MLYLKLDMSVFDRYRILHISTTMLVINQLHYCVKWKRETIHYLRVLSPIIVRFAQFFSVFCNRLSDNGLSKYAPFEQSSSDPSLYKLLYQILCQVVNYQPGI